MSQKFNPCGADGRTGTPSGKDTRTKRTKTTIQRRAVPSRQQPKPDSDGRLSVLSLSEGDEADAAMAPVFVLRGPKDENDFLHRAHLAEMRLNHLFGDLTEGTRVESFLFEYSVSIR